ncbi:MAG: DUF4178 domain-containing protein [bacterium]
MRVLDSLRGRFRPRPRESGIGERDPTNIRPMDVVSYGGEDYIVESGATVGKGDAVSHEYTLVGGTRRVLLRITPEGTATRMCILEEIRNMHPRMPPGESIAWRNKFYFLEDHKETEARIEGPEGTIRTLPVEIWNYESSDGDLISVERREGKISARRGTFIREEEITILPGGA